ncbi:MAG: SDR family oxidoreductase [Dermatophilaceae bacterium]
MDLGLAGRVFIVTGASAGLGFASAQALVDDGAKVVICSRTPPRIDAAVAALGAGSARGLALNLADPDVADRLVAEAITAYGRLDGAILSVGGPPGGQAKDIDDEQWRVSFETVFLGPLRVARAVLDSGEGKSVTFVLSSSVKSPVAGLGISNALRPGLAGAAKSMAEEYGPTGGRVTMVLPGRLDTDRIKELEGATSDPAAARAQFEALIPLGRYGRPEELGRVAAFLVSPAASYLTGIAVPVDGGLTRSL